MQPTLFSVQLLISFPFRRNPPPIRVQKRRFVYLNCRAIGVFAFEMHNCRSALVPLTRNSRTPRPLSTNLQWESIPDSERVRKGAWFDLQPEPVRKANIVHWSALKPASPLCNLWRHRRFRSCHPIQWTSGIQENLWALLASQPRRCLCRIFLLSRA